MSEENCIMCQKSIGKEENKWALQIRSSIWIHYHCLENLWSSFNATPFQKQLRAENERLREALRKIANFYANYDPYDPTKSIPMDDIAQQVLKEVTK